MHSWVLSLILMLTTSGKVSFSTMCILPLYTFSVRNPLLEKKSFSITTIQLSHPSSGHHVVFAKVISHVMYFSMKYNTLPRILNPLRANFLKESINICHSLHWHDTGSWNPSWWTERTYQFYIVSWVLMSWQNKESWHQQPWYAFCWIRLFWS